MDKEYIHDELLKLSIELPRHQSVIIEKAGDLLRDLDIELDADGDLVE